MHPDMLLLAERLVIAMEAMSQDVRNMSAYVYDIRCSVSYLLNERIEKESISVEACDECDDPSFATAEQYEQADERPSWYMDPEQGDNSFTEIGITRADHLENSDVLSSESNSVFTRRIKTEEQSEVEINNESCVMDNIYGDKNNDEGYSTYGTRFPREQARTHQSEGAEDDSVVCTRVNAEEKHPKCTVCGKSFTCRSALQKHTRVHTGERPYMCNVCGKGFSERSNLSKHLRTHTGERPYHCMICGKGFSQNITLRDHMGTHTGEKPYSCMLCGKGFRRRFGLTQHIPCRAVRVTQSILKK